jgi:hypothetical protein
MGGLELAFWPVFSGFLLWELLRGRLNGPINMVLEPLLAAERAGTNVHLEMQDYPSAARLGGGSNESRDVAQPGRAHPWGG